MRRISPLTTLVSCLLLLLSAGQALAATYHVAQNALGADDTADGLSATWTGAGHGPWKSVGRALWSAQAGDRIVIHSGDYRGEGHLAVARSGYSGAPVVVEGEGRPVLSCLHLRRVDWVELRGLRLVGDLRLPAHWQDMPAMVVDNPSVVIDPNEAPETRLPKARVKYSTYFSIMDQFLSHWQDGVCVASASNILITDCDLEKFTAGINCQSGSTQIRILGNRFRYCRNAVFTWQTAPALSDSEISGNQVVQSFGDAFDIRESSTRLTLINNISEYAGIGHIALHTGANNCRITRNRVQFGGYYSETMDYPGSTAINIHMAGPGNVVDGNLAAYQLDATGNDGNGFIADLMPTGCTVVFENNIAWRNQGSGITMTEAPGCSALHNVLAENGFQRVKSNNGAGLRISRKQDVGLSSAGNIFSNNTTAAILAFGQLASQAVVDGNLYEPTPGRPLVTNGGQSYASVASVQQGLRLELRGREGNAGFNAPQEGDFRLVETSTAIGAARKDTSPSTDRLGLQRDARPDMGAYEFQRKPTAALNLLLPN